MEISLLVMIFVLYTLVLSFVKIRELGCMATRDKLTGLINLLGLDEVVRVAFARASRDRRERGNIALLFIDVNFFKPINDTFGHSAGDTVLKKLSDLLVKSVRASDTVARIGGDEFVVLLPGEDFSSAEKIAEIIKSLIKEEMFSVFDTKGKIHKFPLGLSVGVASTSEGFSTFEQLKTVADERMYMQKQKR